MEKQLFLDRVRQTLSENGLDDKSIERQMVRISQYIDDEGGDHVERMLDEEDPVLLAEEICAILRRNAARRAAVLAEEEVPQLASLPSVENTSEQTVQFNAVPEQTTAEAEQVLPDVSVFDAPVTDAPTREIDIVELPTVVQSEDPAADYTEMPVLNLDEDVRIADFSSPEPRRDKRDRRRKTLEVDRMQSRAAEYASEKGGPLFWVLFILSLPFAAVIGLAVIFLFIAAFAALTVLMIAGFAALIGVAAGGTAFTLVALIYGIVQTFTTLPIGLYEIGIAVTAGAAVLFVSILLYNFSVRLLPFVMKQLGRFFGWSIRRLKMLFIYVKGACAKL